MPEGVAAVARGLDGLQRSGATQRVDVGLRQAPVERGLRGALAQLGDQLAGAGGGIARP